MLQQMLKMLPSSPNALSLTVEHFGGVIRKLLKSLWRMFLGLPERGHLFHTLYLLNFPTNKFHKMLN
jgi:hypothetical protein